MLDPVCTQPLSNQTDIARQNIHELGFTILKDFFTQDELAAFEACVVELFLLQAEKIGEYRSESLKLQNSHITPFEKFCAIYEKMEQNDKEALYQVQKFLPSSPTARALFN